jgi:hypothetical protein
MSGAGAGTRLVNDISMCYERGAYSKYRARNGKQNSPPKITKVIIAERKGQSRRRETLEWIVKRKELLGLMKVDTMYAGRLRREKKRKDAQSTGPSAQKSGGQTSHKICEA